MNKAFVGGTWSDSEEEDQPTNEVTCLMAQEKLEVSQNPSITNNLDTSSLQKENENLVKFDKDFRKTFEKIFNEKLIIEQERVKLNERVYELEREVKKLNHDKEVIEPCKKCESLTLKVDSLNDKVSKLQKESLSFSKFNKSTSDLEEIISRQKRSQDKEGLGFSKHVQTTSISLTKPLAFVKAKENETLKISESDALPDASTRQTSEEKWCFVKYL